MTDAPAISVVLPCYNEEGNLRPLVRALHDVLRPRGVPYEIIVTDDGSTDGSWTVLRDLASADPHLRAQRFTANAGESAALWAGMQVARGRILVTLDADLQNDPADLPRLLDALPSCDCVCGSRVESRRQGDTIVRVLSSRIANWVRNTISGEHISDSGCTFRAFRRECIADLKYFKGMHRFFPTLVRLEGFRVTEVPIRTRPRHAGKTKYGIWNRLFASTYDLLAVRWMKKRMHRFAVAERLGPW